MIRKIYLVILISCLILLQSCDNGWDFDVPGCKDKDASNYDPNASFDNGSCLYDCQDASYEEECFEYGCSCYWLNNQCHDSQELDLIYDIDATSYDDWIYFSFQLGMIVEIENPESSLGWDIAFKRNHMKTNGGLSGSGSVCAIVDDSNNWSNETFNECVDMPDYECQTDDLIQGNIFTYQGCYNNQTHIFESCIKNPALDQWGEFDDSYYFNNNNYQFFIKDINGLYIKFWPISYYDINGESGKISMTYQYIN